MMTYIRGTETRHVQINVSCFEHGFSRVRQLTDLHKDERTTNETPSGMLAVFIWLRIR
jgi:hypothetical protein